MASRRRTDASTGIQRIDARSGTIMPGLVDAGFHPTYFNVAAFEDLDIKYPVEYVTLSGPCGEVTIRDLTKGKELERKDAGKWSKSLALSPDGKFLASGYRNGFRVWSTATLEEVLVQDLQELKNSSQDCFVSYAAK